MHYHPRLPQSDSNFLYVILIIYDRSISLVVHLQCLFCKHFLYSNLCLDLFKCIWKFHSLFVFTFGLLPKLYYICKAMLYLTVFHCHDVWQQEKMVESSTEYALIIASFLFQGRSFNTAYSTYAALISSYHFIRLEICIEYIFAICGRPFSVHVTMLFVYWCCKQK